MDAQDGALEDALKKEVVIAFVEDVVEKVVLEEGSVDELVFVVELDVISMELVVVGVELLGIV